MASTLPHPLSTGLFSNDEDLNEQMRRAHNKSEGKKKNTKNKRGISVAHVEPLSESELAPIIAQTAWSTPKAAQIPSKLTRGRSNRLYL